MEILSEINSLLCYPYIVAVSIFAYLILRYVVKNPNNTIIFLSLVGCGIAMYLLRSQLDHDTNDVIEESYLLSFLVAAVTHESVTRLVLSKFERTAISSGGIIEPIKNKE